MHPDRMHLHHRMLRIGHTVRSAVLILWGWAALIAFGSLFILFFPLRYVLIGLALAAILLTFATLYPYYRRRLPEIRRENAILAAQGSQHAARPSRHRKGRRGDKGKDD